MIRVLVIGGTGFTGQAVLEALLKRSADIDVSVFARSESKFNGVIDRLKSKGFTNTDSLHCCVGNLDDVESLRGAMRGIDRLIYVASLGFGHARDVVSTAQECGINRAIFTSTTGIFTKLNPASKAVRCDAEEIISSASLNSVIIRPTMIFGRPGDRNMERLLRYLNRYPILPIFGDGKSLQQPVFVQELGEVLVEAALTERSLKPAYNVSGATALTYNQVVDTASAALNRRVLKLHIPLWLSTLVVGLCEKILSRPPIKLEQVHRLNEDKAFSHEDAVTDLGYTPTPFSEVISKEVIELKELRRI